MSTIVVHEDKPSLTTREFKGLKFEQYVSHKLENLAIPYQRQSSKADFLLPYGVQLEAKFSHAIIYPCWIRRDWITRFTPEAKLKLVITNRGIKLTEKSKQLLKENNIYLIYYDEDKKLKSLYEWLRFLFEGGREGVTNLIEVYNLVKGYSVYSYCTVLTLGYTKPSIASTQSVKTGHLAVETLDPSVKRCYWRVNMSSLEDKLSKVIGYLIPLKSLLVLSIWVRKRLSEGVLEEIRRKGRVLSLLTIFKINQAKEVVKYEYEKIGIKNKSSHRESNPSSI